MIGISLTVAADDGVTENAVAAVPARNILRLHVMSESPDIRREPFALLPSLSMQLAAIASHILRGLRNMHASRHPADATPHKSPYAPFTFSAEGLSPR
jgi:hypothetical protein